MKNQIAHIEAEVQHLLVSCKEFQGVLRRLAEGEAEIARLKELVPKEKPNKCFISYEKLLYSATSVSEESGNKYRRHFCNRKKSRASTSTSSNTLNYGCTTIGGYSVQ